MPNPFKQKRASKDAGPGLPDGAVAITNSVLTCEYCFHESSEGTYYPESKTLTWICDNNRCGGVNIVKNFEL